MRKSVRSLTRDVALAGAVLVGLSASPAVISAQCNSADLRNAPRIGLVLGGGGARGGAHVGVLRFLEENNIPVDMIAGTSMGAIIGGLYAAGMSANEIEEVMLETPWNEIFTDATRRGQRTLRRKSDDELNLHGPKLGLGEGSALLPSGAVAGQKIGLLFEQLVSERTRVGDFDALLTHKIVDINTDWRWQPETFLNHLAAQERKNVVICFNKTVSFSC